MQLEVEVPLDDDCQDKYAIDDLHLVIYSDGSFFFASHGSFLGILCSHRYLYFNVIFYIYLISIVILILNTSRLSPTPKSSAKIANLIIVLKSLTNLRGTRWSINRKEKIREKKHILLWKIS